MKWKDWDSNLKVRLLGEGVMNLLFWMFFPFMAIYFSNSFGKEAAGMLLIASQVVSVAVGLVGGYCADHFGRKRMMIIAGIGEAVCFVFFALANSPIMESPVLTFISFSALGLFGSLYWPASHAMVADVVPEKHRASVFAVFYTSINISVVLGPILGGIFFFNDRFPLLLVCLGVSITLVFIMIKFIRETAPEKEQRQQKEKNKNEDVKWTRYLSEHLSDYKVIVNDKTFLLFILAGVLVGQTFMQLDLLMAVYSTDFVPKQSLFSLGSFSISADGKQAFSWLISENGLIVALFTVAMNRWMVKYPERRIFILSALFYGVAIIIFGHTVNIWVLFAAIVIFTSAELMVVGIQESFVSKLAPEHMRGQYFAASSLRFTLGRTIAPLAIPMTVWFGYSWTFIILGILAFISAGLYHIMFKMIDKNRQVNTRRQTAIVE